MDIRRKYYPYPVLSEYSDDYLTSKFKVDVKVEMDGYDIGLRFNANLENDELENLLEKKEVLITYHLECTKTGFRKALTTTSKELNHLISNKDINGRLQICSFIVAAKDFNGYVNNDFHQDYTGVKFQIEAGCIMAVDDPFNIDIEKNIDDLANTSSVFSIVKNTNETANGMLMEMNQNKIIISIPETSFNELQILNKNITLQPTINSLIIIPALVYVLEELKACPVKERDEFSSYGWYRAIRKALIKQFNCEVESDNFTGLNHFQVAQKLIGSPFDNAINSLFYEYKNDLDDEEVEE
jgi:predicted ribonuclease YlaK